MKYDIFVSYSRKDSDIVYKTVQKLESAGFTVWIDKDGIESGDAFKSVLVKAIENSRCVVFFSSKYSNESPWTTKEIAVAIHEGKRIIPVRLDDSRYNSEIKFDLVNLDFIDMSDGSKKHEATERLLKSLSNLKSKEESEQGVAVESKPEKREPIKQEDDSSSSGLKKNGRYIIAAIVLAIAAGVIIYLTKPQNEPESPVTAQTETVETEIGETGERENGYDPGKTGPKGETGERENGYEHGKTELKGETGERENGYEHSKTEPKGETKRESTKEQRVGVSYGVYSGPSNGLGGEIKVTRHYSLDLRNADHETIELQPGDIITKTRFKDGELISGYLQTPSGNRYFHR